MILLANYPAKYLIWRHLSYNTLLFFVYVICMLKHPCNQIAEHVCTEGKDHQSDYGKIGISNIYWYIFPWKCAWKVCFPILSAQGEIPASGSMHPSRRLPPREKIKSNRGDPALHLHQARGHLN